MDIIQAQSLQDQIAEEKRKFEEEKNNIDIEVQSLLSNLQKYKLIYEKQAQAKSKRENAPITWDTINDVTNSTRYSRQQETKDVLQYIHGGMEGAIFGTWDFF